MGKIYMRAKDLIKDVFDEFKTFVGIYDIDFNSIILDEDSKLGKEKNHRVFAKVTWQNGVPILHYDPEIIHYNGKHLTAILFHEFTHALHILKPFNAGSEDEWYALMFTKSEFIASEVEMAYILGVKKFDLCIDENASESTFYICNKIRTNTREYILVNLNAARSVISKGKNEYSTCCSDEYSRNYRNFHNSAMYYFGKKTAYEMILGKQFDCREEEYFLQFNQIMQRFSYVIQTNDAALILGIEKELYDMFKSCFPNKNI